jgi:hypothetical protein
MRASGGGDSLCNAYGGIDYSGGGSQNIRRKGIHVAEASGRTVPVLVTTCFGQLLLS